MIGPDSSVPLVEVDIGLFADQVGVSTTDTLYAGERIHDLVLAINLRHVLDDIFAVLVSID